MTGSEMSRHDHKEVDHSQDNPTISPEAMDSDKPMAVQDDNSSQMTQQPEEETQPMSQAQEEPKQEDTVIPEQADQPQSG